MKLIGGKKGPKKGSAKGSANSSVSKVSGNSSATGGSSSPLKNPHKLTDGWIAAFARGLGAVPSFSIQKAEGEKQDSKGQEKLKQLLIKCNKNGDANDIKQLKDFAKGAKTPEEFAKKICDPFDCFKGVILSQPQCDNCHKPLGPVQKTTCSTIEVPYVNKGEWDDNLELLTADVLATYFHGHPDGEHTCPHCKQKATKKIVRAVEKLPESPVIVFTHKPKKGGNSDAEPEEITVGELLIWKVDGQDKQTYYDLCSGICMESQDAYSVGWREFNQTKPTDTWHIQSGSGG